MARVEPAAPVLVAPDKFKGTFSAGEVANAIARGLRGGGREAVELPLADGGDGTMDVLLGALGGERRTVATEDALGREIEAELGLIDKGRTAIVELAQASGLWRIGDSERDAWRASTRGTGRLIAAAVEAGARSVIVCAGGSATTDGGAGALEVLGDRADLQVVVVCDVRSTWEDAARVFAPQKGADSKTVDRLARRLDDLAGALPRDPRGRAMTGAAGGLAGGLWAALGARLVPGAAFVLDTVGFDAQMRMARFVVTGEGQLDEQTLAGKTAGEVATRCRQAGVACHAVVGKDDLDAFRARVLDFASVSEATDLAALEAAGRKLSEV